MPVAEGDSPNAVKAELNCGPRSFWMFWPAVLTLSSLLLLAFDGVLIWAVARTMLAWSDPSAPGVIMKSEVEERLDDDGTTTYRPRVSYRYRVGDREFTGERLTFFDLVWTSSARARSVVKDWAVGREVTVYYRSSQPDDAVLSRSIDGEPFFLALVLLPFHAVMWGGWKWAIGQMRGPRDPLQRVGTHWELSRTSGDPLAVAMIAASLLSFVATLMIGASGWTQNLPLLMVVWLLVAITSFAASRHTRSIMGREPLLLIVDDTTGVWTWPAAPGVEEFRIEAAQVRSVDIDEAHPGIVSRDGVTDYLVQVTYQDANGQAATRPVQKTTSARQALLLAEWLEGWLNRNRPA